jgi:hypothetical protein
VKEKGKGVVEEIKKKEEDYFALFLNGYRYFPKLLRRLNFLKNSPFEYFISNSK